MPGKRHTSNTKKGDLEKGPYQNRQVALREQGLILLTMRLLGYPRTILAFGKDFNAFQKVTGNGLVDISFPFRLTQMALEVGQKTSGYLPFGFMFISREKERSDFLKAQIQLLKPVDDVNLRKILLIVKPEPTPAPLLGIDESQFFIIPNGSERQPGLLGDLSDFHQSIPFSHMAPDESFVEL